MRPKWVEKAASDLLKWSYGEPEWDATRAAAVVPARATLYGLTVVAARHLELSRSDPAGAREIFIWRALVEGDWDDAPAFVGQNRDLLDESQALLQRARRHEVMGGDQALFEFYAFPSAGGRDVGRSVPGLVEALRAQQPGRPGGHARRTVGAVPY